VNFLPGQVFVSVKGGEVITGGAPLDLIVEKVQTIQAMFYRTIEFIKDMPLRVRGDQSARFRSRADPGFSKLHQVAINSLWRSRNLSSLISSGRMHVPISWPGSFLKY